MKSVIYPIPTRLSCPETEHILQQHAPWFYNYKFVNGAETESLGPLINEIHQVRADLIFPFLDMTCDSKWSTIRCLDIGCHEAWFSIQLAVRGAREVLGTDVREEHLRKASVIKEIANLSNISFLHKSVYDLPAAGIGVFDLTFFVGLL